MESYRNESELGYLDMVGLSVSDSLGFSSIQEFYRTIAEKLSRLPK